MLTLRHPIVPMFSLLILSGGMLSAHAQTNYPITDYTKTNNIFTNLNEQFPHTGTGSPGSATGTPNQTFVFDPTTYTSTNAIAGANKATNGVTFTLASNATGQDFTEIFGLPNSTLTIPVSVPDASSVHLLVNGYGNPSANFTFTGTGGATETFFNVQIHDFNGGGIRNNSFTVNGSATPNLFDQSVFEVQDVGAGGTGNSTTGFFNNYGVNEDSFVLSSAFADQTLESISIDAGSSNTILLGVTVTGASAGPAATPEPSSIALFASSGFAGLAFLRRRHRNRKTAFSRH